MKRSIYIADSDEWKRARCAVPTASEFASIITPKKLEISASLPAYVAIKLAEKWLGGPLQGFAGSYNTDQGKVREAELRGWYALEYGVDLEPAQDSDPTKPEKCLFITDDAETMGASPDAMVRGQRLGVEFKNPNADTHVAWLIAGGLPKDYLLQVQGQMLVTGYDEWEFVSGYPRLPSLVVRVKRDEKICDALEQGIEEFWVQFTRGWAKLIDANGGEGPKEPAWESFTDESGATVRRVKPDWDNPIMPADQLKWFNQGVAK